MWAITNNTPFAAERCWARDKDGAEVWLVAVRGTFSIGPDGSTWPAEEQDPVRMPPKYRGDPANSSLLADSDLNPTKRTTDVVLHGHAYAPGNEPTTQADVSLKVGTINKTLRAIGDRVFQRGLFGIGLSKAEPFAKLPIVYERAYGGTDIVSDDPRKHDWERRNPVGTGFATDVEHLLGKRAPNIEDPHSLYGMINRRPAPAGFGPIPGHWLPRLKFAGTYDAKWEKERQPLLPEDFDERFYQCAPQDQQTSEFLKGGELVELSRLTPSGLLKFRIPRARFLFRTYFDGEGVETHRAVLHTVMLEPDVPRVILVWHSRLPCHHKVLKLLETRISVLPRINVPAQDDLAGAWTGPDEETL
jgi:hypothetical protein